MFFSSLIPQKWVVSAEQLFVICQERENWERHMTLKDEEKYFWWWKSRGVQQLLAVFTQPWEMKMSAACTLWVLNSFVKKTDILICIFSKVPSGKSFTRLLCGCKEWRLTYLPTPFPTCGFRFLLKPWKGHREWWSSRVRPSVTVNSPHGQCHCWSWAAVSLKICFFSSSILHPGIIKKDLFWIHFYLNNNKICFIWVLRLCVYQCQTTESWCLGLPSFPSLMESERTGTGSKMEKMLL